MDFSEYAKILYPLSGLKNQGDFVVLIFERITDFGEDNDYCLNIKPNTAKAYFNGNSSISMKAKEMAPHLDARKFQEFLEELLSYESSETLVNTLKKYDASINVQNVFEKASLMLKSIIEKAAGIDESEDTNNYYGTTELKKEYGRQLLIEANNVCHYDGCGKTLYIKEDEKSSDVYEVVIIDDNKNVTSSNLIALCQSCASKYNINKTNEKIRRLKEIKDNLVQKEIMRTTASEVSVDRGIRAVINKIADLSLDKEIQLNFNPVTVKEKIPNNVPLYEKVKSYVSLYYDTVKQIFKEADQEKIIKYNSFSASVKYTYEKLKEEGVSQSKIFSSLVEWLTDATNEDIEYCEIIVSYYIQNCEVFDASSK